MDNVYENIDDYNPYEKRKILIVFDDMIAEAQHDLDRLAVKMSAYSSGDLRKCEYLTGEDLGYKPSVIEQAQFKYSPLGMSLCKAFKKDKVKSAARSKSDFNYDSNHAFHKFYKEYD